MRASDFLTANGPIIVRRDHPEHAAAIGWALRTGQLVRTLPGVLLVPEIADDLRWRMAAVAAWDPDAVIVGEAAAEVSFWPELPVTEIEVAARSATRSPGYRFSRRSLPTDLIDDSRRVRRAVPALAALDTIGTQGTDAIDRALRSRRVSLDDLWAALRATPHRAGNREKCRALVRSRHKPWSHAERLAHQLLDAAGIRTGWKANHKVWVQGRLYLIDIAFRGQLLAVEIDGRLHEDDPDIFETDRTRQNALIRAGWRVLRFTMAMLTDSPTYFIAEIRAALAAS